MIFDVSRLTIGRYGRFWRSRDHPGGFILIEVGVIAHRECSGLMKGSQMNELIGRAGKRGGVFNTIGSTLDAQDEWVAVMMRQELATLSPMSGYATLQDSTNQWAALSPLMNVWMLRPSWLGMTMATIMDNERMRRSCAMMDRWSFQNEDVTSLVWKR